MTKATVVMIKDLPQKLTARHAKLESVSNINIISAGIIIDKMYFPNS